MADSDPSQPRATPSLLAQAGGFSFAALVAWLTVDILQGRRADATPADFLPVLLAVSLAGAAAIFLSALVVLGISRAIGPRRPFLCLLPGTAIVLFCLNGRILELFDGDWVSQQAWQPLGRWAAVVLFAAGLLGGGQMILRAAAQDRARRLAVGVVFVLLSCLFFFLEQLEFLARKYAAAHDILAFCGLSAAGLAGLCWTPGWWRRPAGLLFGGGVISLVLIVAGAVDLEDAATRSTLFRKSRITARLMSLLPWGSEASELGPVDADLLEQLKRSYRLEEEVLDALMPDRRRQDVIIITVDTLRHDALGAQGGRANTPHMDSFLKDSVSFQQAWSQFPSTRYAVNSLLAGQYPTSVDLENEKAATRGKNLPESLADAGYVTLAYTSFPTNLFAVDKKHLTRGFSNFENDPGDRATKSQRVVEKTMAAFDQRPAGGPPIFMWLHLFDPHGPPTNRGGLGAEAPLRDRYDKEVEYADSCLGPFFEFIERKLNDPLVILHSDHGEEFSEHGGVGHNSSLYQEQIHVPLAIRGRGLAPRRESHPVELVDVPATVRELVGLPAAEFDKGQSLAGLLVAADSANHPPALGFSQFRWPQFVHGNLDAVRDRRWKLIHDRDLDLFELYDLEADPGESENLEAANPEELRRMQTILQTMRSFAGSDVEEEASRRADEALVRKAVRGTLSTPELSRFLAVLRRGPLADRADLVALLDHDERPIRQATLVQALIQEDARALQHLRQRAAASDGPSRIEARIALAIAGDDVALADLPLVTTAFPGPRRLLPVLARVAAGERELAPALHQNIAAGEGDPDVDTLMIKTLVGLRDSGLLPALYIRLGLGQVNAGQVKAAVAVAEQFPFELAAPIIRRILCSPDQGLRQQAEAVVSQRDQYKSWQDDAIAAERLALKSKHVFDGRKKTIEICCGFLGEAIGTMSDLAILDYGLALDLSVLVNSFGARPKLVPPVEKAIKKSGVTGGPARAIVDRLLRIASSSGRKAVGRMEILPGQEIQKGESGRIPLLVRVTLDDASAPLVGGITLWTAYLTGSLLDPDGKVVGLPPGFVLPATGLMPGESLVLCAPVHIPQEVRAGSRIVVELGMGANKMVLPPVSLEIP